jgi:mRNA-degrading endonuclease RelE of RelBE toxin-antitoxin system
MTDSAASYPTILKQARKLPTREQRQLAEALLRPTNGDEQVVLVSMRRLQSSVQAHFLELMDRHNAGNLTPKGLEELQSLVARYEELTLSNTEMLLKATYPELFTTAGRPRRKALERTLRLRTGSRRDSSA